MFLFFLYLRTTAAKEIVLRECGRDLEDRRQQRRSPYSQRTYKRLHRHAARLRLPEARTDRKLPTWIQQPRSQGNPKCVALSV